MERSWKPICDRRLAWAGAGCLLAVVLAGRAIAAPEIDSPAAPATMLPDTEPTDAVPPAPAAAPAQPPAADVSRPVVVIAPLVAVAALMGLYWLILRSGAV